MHNSGSLVKIHRFRRIPLIKFETFGPLVATGLLKSILKVDGVCSLALCNDTFVVNTSCLCGKGKFSDCSEVGWVCV